MSCSCWIVMFTKKVMVIMMQIKMMDAIRFWIRKGWEGG